MKTHLVRTAHVLISALALSLLPALGANAVDAPTNLQAVSTSSQGTATDSASIEVSWERPASLPVGYSVRASAEGADAKTGSVYRCLELLCRSTIAGLNGGFLYTITVTAFGSSTASASQTIDATAISAPYPAVPRTQVALSASEVRLGWSQPNNSSGLAVTEYVVRDGATIVATSSNLSVVVSGLTAETQYTFNIAAKNALGESATTSFASVTTLGSAPDAPSAPSATATGANLAISWTAPGQGSAAITGYKVYLLDSSGVLVGSVRAPSPTTATSLTATGLADGVYRVAVLATNRWGDGASSSQTTVTVGTTSGSSGGAAPASPTPATTSNTTSPATQSTDSPAATGSAPVGPPLGSAKISDFLSGGAVSEASKEVVINRAWRLVRASVGAELNVIIRDLAPARARVSTWARTPNGQTFRLASRTTTANGLVASPSYQFNEPGTYKISWVYRGVKRSLVVFVSE